MNSQKTRLFARILAIVLAALVGFLGGVGGSPDATSVEAELMVELTEMLPQHRISLCDRSSVSTIPAAGRRADGPSHYYVGVCVDPALANHNGIGRPLNL